jgi:hypothetical protein
LDGSESPWDDQSFAFLGDLVHNLVSTIVFPENAFKMQDVWAKTSAYMLQHLNELQESQVFPPNLPDPDDLDLEEIRTRRFMFLPAVYVPLFISSRGYKIQQMWKILYPAVEPRQELVICASLICWLQAASTGAAGENPLIITAPVISVALQAPPADELLLANHHSILHRALPQLSAPPASLETALTHIAAALEGQANNNHLASDQKLAEDLEPKLSSKRFQVTLLVLLEYLQVTNEQDLPLIWHSWANCAKRQEVQVLQDTLDAFAREPKSFSASIPVVTVRLA